MVQLYVAGRMAGTLADSDRVIRKADGRVLGTFAPAHAEPPCPWDPSITWEEIERRRAGEFLTFDELKARMGWK